jgi:ClpP class serine protease
VWGGQDALALGLVDSNGTLETLMAAHPDLKLVNFGPFERNRGLVPDFLESLDDIAVSLKDGVGLLKGTAPS